MNNYPSVTEIIRDAGLISEFSIGDTDAAKRGRLVSAASHIFAKREDIDPEWLKRHHDLRGYLDGYRKFLNLSPSLNLVWAEVGMKDEQERFVGHPDQIFECPVEKGLAIVDVKTGAIPSWGRLQVAGYALLARRMFATRQIRHRWILNLPGDGTYKLKSYDDPRDLDDFLILVRAYHVRAKYIGAPANG